MRYGLISTLSAFVVLSAQLAAAQSSTLLPWRATFDGGNLSEWNGFSNGTGAAVVSSGCASGRCLRSPFVVGSVSDNYGDFHFGDFVTVRGPKVEEVWLSVWSKFENVTAWPNRSQKIAILNLTDGMTWTRHYQVTLLVWPNGEYGLERTDLDNWLFWGVNQNVGSPVRVRMNQWDRLKVYVRLNTPGRADGVARLWVNGTLVLDHTNVNVRFNTNYGFNKLNLSTRATQASASGGAQWHDSFTLSESDPNGSSSPPGAPSNVRILQ
jgi:hypothetical protein